MPTIPEIKAQLKERGIKGTTGKNKAELMAMLADANLKVPAVREDVKALMKKIGVPLRKRPQVAPVSAPEVPKRKRPQVAPTPTPLPVYKPPSPPPIIPAVIKKEMKNDLSEYDYDFHKYRLGGAYPIDTLIKRFKFLIGRNERFYGKDKGRIANNFLSDLTKWVKANSYEAMAYPFNDVRDKEKILLDEDWSIFYTVNK